LRKESNVREQIRLSRKDKIEGWFFAAILLIGLPALIHTVSYPY
jgi:hypothetical protein